MAKTLNMDQVIARLRDMPIASEFVPRLVMVQNSQSELFGAASRILEWLGTVQVEDRPIALFNRLQDAVNGVREAHQMEPRNPTTPDLAP